MNILYAWSFGKSAMTNDVLKFKKVEFESSCIEIYS